MTTLASVKKRIASGSLKRGHDICGHGYRWVEHYTLNKEEERDAKQSAVKSIQEITGGRPLVGCGHCSFCIVGRLNLCANLRRPGFEFFGGFAEFVKVPIRNLLPSSLGHHAAILTDAGAVMLHSLRGERLQPGMRVVIAGVGVSRNNGRCSL